MEKSIWHKSTENMLAVERLQLERLAKTAPSDALFSVLLSISKLEKEVASMDKEYYAARDKKQRTISESKEELSVITDGKQYLSVDWGIADSVDRVEMVDDITKATMFTNKDIDHYFKEFGNTITDRKLFWTKIVKITRFEYSDEI